MSKALQHMRFRLAEYLPILILTVLPFYHFTFTFYHLHFAFCILHFNVFYSSIRVTTISGVLLSVKHHENKQRILY